MADSSDKMRRDFEALKRDYERFTKMAPPKMFAQMSDDTEEAKKQMALFEAAVNNARREARGLFGVFSDLESQLKANLAEISKTNTATRTGQRAYAGLVKEVEKLADEQAGIYSLSLKELKTSKDRAKSSLRILEDSIKGVQAEIDARERAGQQATDSQLALLKAKQENLKQENLAVAKIEQRLSLERKVIDNVKLTGGALQGIGNLAASLGLSGFAESISDISQKLEDDVRAKLVETAEKRIPAAKKLSALDKETLAILQEKQASEEGLTDEEKQQLTKLEKKAEAHQDALDIQLKQVKAADTLGAKFKALGSAAKEFVKQLQDPLVLLAGMLKGYLAVDKAATQFQRTTGENARAIAGMNSNLVTSEETLALMSQFADETNMNLNNLMSTQQVGRLAETAKLLGFSAEESGKLAQNVLLSGTSTDSFTDQVFEAAKAVNVARGEGTNLGSVIKEASSVSADLALSLDSNPAALGRAAIEAQRLGLSLDKVAGIADTMLDFESSIQAELEAQLLTGRQINLGRAREAALMNDMETLAKEIGKAGGVAEQFTKGTRVEQNALAKALGMSREDLAKMVGLEKLRAGTLTDAEAKMMGMTKEQLMQMDVQEKFQTAIGKLQQALGPLIDAFIPLVDLMILPVQYLGEMLAYVGQLGPAIRKAFNVDEIMESPFGGLLKILGGVVGGVVTFKLGTALLAWATRGTFMNPMVVTDVKGGGVFKMFKGLFTKGGLSKLLFGQKIGGQFMKGGGRAAAGTVKGGIIPTITKFYNNLSTRFNGLFKNIKFFGKFGKIFAKGSVIFTALLVAAEAVTNFFEYGFIKGIEKTLRDNAGAILGTVVGALLAPFTGGLSLIIGPAIGAILDYFDVFGLKKGFEEPGKQEMATYNSNERLQDFIIRPGQPPAAFDKGDVVVGLRPEGIQSGGGSDTSSLEKKLDELIDRVASIRGDVFIDGNKTGQAIFASATNLS